VGNRGAIVNLTRLYMNIFYLNIHCSNIVVVTKKNKNNTINQLFIFYGKTCTLWVRTVA